MANYTGGGGGGGGAAVVPATLVVADDRADYPLTQTGLVDALTELATIGGGDIYLGEGALALTSVVTIPCDVRIHGSGIGCTLITLAAGIVGFQVGDFALTMSDFTLTGNTSAGQTFLLLTAAAAINPIVLFNLQIGIDPGFTADGVRIVLDADNKARNWEIYDCIFNPGGASSSLLLDGAGGNMQMSNVITGTNGGSAFAGGTTAVDMSNCRIYTGGDITFATTSKISSSLLNASGTLTFGTSCMVSGCTITGSTTTVGASCNFSASSITGTVTTGNTCSWTACAVTGALTFGNTCNATGGSASGAVTTGTSCNVSGMTMSSTLTAGASSTFTACTITSTAAPAASCLFTGCTIGGAVTVSGASTKFVGCTLVSFSSTSLNSHVLEGNSFSGGGNNVTLASSSSCTVLGNPGAQVVESGSSDSNTFSSISASSTLIGASSVVTDVQKFVFTSPGTLTTTDNALFARIPPQVTQGVRLLSVEVETAPTGANLIIEFKIGTRSTGALAAAFATLTLTAGAFTASTTVAAITITSAQFLVVAITQVGSTIPGSNATIVARA